MKTRGLVALAGFALAMLCAVFAARVADRHRATLELGRTARTRLTPRAAESLARLTDDVLVTYWVSRAEHMPPHLRHLERDVVAVLETLRRASDGRLDYSVVDPEAGSAGDRERLRRHLTRIGVAPFRARRVERDGYTETSVHSTLEIAMGPRPAARIDALAPGHLPGLQDLLAAHLDLLATPRRPLVALSAPDGFAELRRHLLGEADVLDWNFEEERRLPEDADLFLWMDPGRVEPAHLAALEDFRRRGRSAVVAASNLRFEHTAVEPEVRLRLWRDAFPAAGLFAGYGLQPADDLVLDVVAGTIGEPGAETTLAPYLLRAIAPNQDFRGLRGQPNGTLLFAAPTPFAIDGPLLAERGLVAQRLVSTTELATRRPLPDGEVTLSAILADPGVSAGKQTLMALLEPADPDDPWSGRLVLCASDSPFRDGLFENPELAHGALVDVLVRTLAAPERLALQEAVGHLPPLIPPLSKRARAGWRALVVLVAPALLVGLGLASGALLRRRRERTIRRAAGLLARAAGGAAIVVAIAALLPTGLAVDATRGRTNSLASETGDVVRGVAHGPSGATLELVFSPDDRLPHAWRPLVRRTLDLARRLARVTDRLSVELVRPRATDPAADPELSADLARDGIRPIEVVAEDEGTRSVRRIWAAIRLRGPVRGDGEPRLGTRVLAFPDAKSFEHVELRLALGLQRVFLDREYVVAVAADTPRLSPAEALLDWQNRGLFAPTEGDVYAGARELLARNDFDVRRVNPAAPELDDPADLLVWLQPRRNAVPMLALLAAHLARGGAALVAAQHYDVLARQLEEGGLGVAFWPQPQFPDLDRHYLPELGVVLVPDVLFDEVAATVPMRVRLDREGGSEYALRPITAPFLVRATGENMDAEDPLTRGLSELVLPSPSRIVLDAERLAERGLTARTLATTSERAWTYAWEGGDLPAEVLRGPDGPDATRPPEGPVAVRCGAVPLAVLVEGPFPRCTPSADGLALEAPAPGAPEGRLLLLGCARTFRDEHLYGAGESDDLLLAAAATLAVGDAFGAIASRRDPSPALGWIEPARRVRLRAWIVGAPSALLVALGVGVRLAGARRRPRRGAPAGAERAA